jgi:small subunit ribosomal protein S20
MPIKKNAMKALRHARKQTIANLAHKRNLKQLLKTSQQLIAAGDAKAEESVKAAIRALDKAAENKKLHRNAAGRKKSRLLKRLKALKK